MKISLSKRLHAHLPLRLALLLSLLMAGLTAPLASAQQTPSPQTLTIYHSTDPTGSDPRPEYPPGCEAPGTSGGGGGDSGFDSFYDSDSGFGSGSGEPGWVVVLSSLSMVAYFNGETTDIQNSQFFDNLLNPNRNAILIGRGSNTETGELASYYQEQDIFVETTEPTEITNAVLAEFDVLVMSQSAPETGTIVTTPSERSAIRSFVEAGNLLLLIAEFDEEQTADKDTLNQFLTAIGSSIAYAGEIEFGGALTVQAGAPFTDNLASFVAPSASMNTLTGGIALVDDPDSLAVVAAEPLGGDPGPDKVCAVNGGEGATYEELELWVSGGDDASTTGIVCKMGAEGGDGDEICGANISFNLSGPARFRSFIPMISTLVIGAECVPTEGVGCILPPANAKDLIVNFRKGDGAPPAGPRRLGSLIVDSSEYDPSDPTPVLITASGEAATAKLQLLEYGKPEPTTPEVIATLPIPMPEPGGTLQLLSGALGLMGLCRLRRRR